MEQHSRRQARRIHQPCLYSRSPSQAYRIGKKPEVQSSRPNGVVERSAVDHPDLLDRYGTIRPGRG